MRKKEGEEYDTQTNIKWSKYSTDTRKLWKMIDWKGEVREDSQNELSPHEIYSFFTKIFQAKKTEASPLLFDIMHQLNDYHQTIPITDNSITIDEVNKACMNTRKGIGFNGLPPDILKIVPHSLKEILQTLVQNVFGRNYPTQWENQLLFPIRKKGHTISDPKLRGIAIGPILSRLYDDILNQRFCDWFKPNLEQAAYRKGQGCVFQIFSLLLVIEHAKNTKKEIFIGLLDFEKAFDYTNRATLITDLLRHGIGHRMAKAIASMYSKASYTPTVSNSSIGNPIWTDHGVTQGRKSSGSLFAFTVSKMPEVLRTSPTQDFMDPFCLVQLADDTSILAEIFESLTYKFSSIFNFSDSKYAH